MAEEKKLPTHPHPLTPSRLSDLYCHLCYRREAEAVDGYTCGTCSLRWRSHKECAEKETVQLPSHPHPLTLLRLSHLYCTLCHRHEAEAVDGYTCGTCSFWMSHKECAESPVEMEHPYHPRHPLTLPPLYADDDMNDKAGVKCNSCGKEFKKEWVYKCRICKFSLHTGCANEPPKLQVDNPKCHDHTLFLLPRPLPFTCNACGFNRDPSLPYVCQKQCDFMVHRNCIDLPRIIKICRHQDRLSHTFSLPHQEWSCRVCFDSIDSNYGAYSCPKEGCGFAAHSMCATSKNLWDGKDLEGVPEEPEEVVEPPFVDEGDGLIKHFSHEHNLKLMEDGGFRRDHCQACALPISILVGNTYSCTQRDCNFALHERCAELPRRIWFILHPHPLALQAFVADDIRQCENCGQLTCAFMYTCCEGDCGFKLDVNCATVSEQIVHSGHPHPLFSTLAPLVGKPCSGCNSEYPSKRMQCRECDFVLCFRCITLPPMVRYRQDEHPLVLGGGEDAKDGGWWCEICETKMDPKLLFYTCDRCCVTVHVHCILGEDRYMQPGRYEDLEIAANHSCSRPSCSICKKRCPFTTVFKKNDNIFCRFHCLSTALRSIGRIGNRMLLR